MTTSSTFRACGGAQAGSEAGRAAGGCRGARGARRIALALALAAGAAALVAPSEAGAQDKSAGVRAEIATGRLASAVASKDEARILEALAAVKAERARAAAPLVNELLRAGGSLALTRLAIETAGALGDPSSSAALAPYTRHREAALRGAAAGALAETGGPDAVAALRAALRSQDAALRAQAAEGLGGLGDPSVVPDLFAALEHGVPSAAPSIARLCAPESCARLLSRAPGFSFATLMGVADALLLRAPGALPEGVQLVVVGQVRALGTPEARLHLERVRARFPANGSAAVRQALDEAIAAMGGKKP